jgi:hypothetical protein
MKSFLNIILFKIFVNSIYYFFENKNNILKRKVVFVNEMIVIEIIKIFYMIISSCLQKNVKDDNTYIKQTLEENLIEKFLIQIKEILENVEENIQKDLNSCNNNENKNTNSNIKITLNELNECLKLYQSI